MFRLGQIKFVKLLCLVWLSWSCAALAITLGAPKLLSRPGEPLKVEFPIKVGQDEQSALSSLHVGISNKVAYDRLGISKKLLDLNPQAMIYRNQQDQLMVLVETVESVPMTDDPFLDVLVTLNWSAGSLTKTYTLLLGDAQKISVRPGQTLSEIAMQLAPQLDGATLDQAMMALFKANPDAFASGSINRLEAGAELTKPSQALLRSISPAEANQFVAKANAQWQSERESKDLASGNSSETKKASDAPAKDRLKIGSSTEGSADEKRYTEELVAQEKVLEQTRARVVELEKNIADLQRLIDESKAKAAGPSGHSNQYSLGGFAPALLALALMAVTGLLLWFLARNARRSEVHDFTKPAAPITADIPHPHSHGAMPDRAKALFAGIDLDLSPVKKSEQLISPDSNPLADALRVKLNLARAYITIEDFDAARKSLEDIVNAVGVADPVITSEAQGLLAELSQRCS
ncbi:FimV/HubP family polar landmark protein [Polynucleobacter sp. AP-Nino-20-G2]|uniref:FimV/HubP family polar landmark protein n=1 Tax=Polynucleobacter sp. AP-Nino-20-G2 TaxID=2576917 RepID=UPI001BFE79F5|nr:FimV/HubP family polar landmark protein [Polynucleobacter sp. AP-Nino-20-G2]QWE15774.1 pilus assembly protein FimV [Polynucleobacter sp. AP-Nino-20-G2]